VTFRAPVRDIAFSLETAAGYGALAATETYADWDLETVRTVLEAAGQVADEVLAPLNRVGDAHGAAYANGTVTTAPGFSDAYRQFSEGGWHGLAAPVEHGGQGAPKAVEVAALETFQAANMAFALGPMLTLGAIEALHLVGSERQKALYLDKLVSGVWSGTMNLTEPQAGTDLAAVTTRAEPDGQGGYLLHGQKIYITWGDHDCAENIVHLVLGRLPDAPAGTKGISLFLAPKHLVNDDGSLGPRNDLRPAGIEHKLGIHGSPTCVMAYEGAKAELVGRPNEGLAHMFIMMNAARLQVGVQGVGIAERAYQQALAYARERRQGRSAWTGEANAPIFDHPDVRRMLAVSRAKIDAARGICLSCAVAADLARVGPEAERARWKLREELLVPIAKAWSTDVGVEVASVGVQVHGGMGFVEETGAAQHYRDARIAPIYEGTNGVQALDLVGRKLGMNGGQAVRDLVLDMRRTAADLAASAEPRLQSTEPPFERAIEAVEAATAWLLERRGTSQPDVLAGATAYLALVGDVAGGWTLAKQALAAEAALASPDADRTWLTGKIALFRVYADNVLAASEGRLAAVRQGADALHALGEALAA
jgi:alkylation response protein AidB-like acyl-CoA dehydrogenase